MIGRGLVDRPRLPAAVVAFLSNTSMAVGSKRNRRGLYLWGWRDIYEQMGLKERRKQKERKKERTFENPDKFSSRTNHLPAEILVTVQINRGALLLQRTAR